MKRLKNDMIDMSIMAKVPGFAICFGSKSSRKFNGLPILWKFNSKSFTIKDVPLTNFILFFL